MPGIQSKLNGKKGGRPKGKRNTKTILKEKVAEAFNQRVYKMADSLINSQALIAQGQTFLYKIEKEKIVGPKGGISYKNKKPVQVTNQYEIEDYLEGLAEDGDIDDDSDPSTTYYYMTAKEPNNMAIDSLMNRSLGKPVESLKLSDPDGKPLQPTVIFIPKSYDSNE